ncbi:type VII toxin-antitoxin system HepT family RNase toxin [Glycomyces buryatensis]|uniref:DUF86 domain-containing protein n=1 Tax=Glycomyces buryatensis TaxID=2570927 RepID=A0A4S8Q933_9ACTN|nr:HepT-like ribonuclease domain-containing protein [Glycomyces buryatensis]THV40943.1 DUF86 domain-containing protein [Glycomyces buryatensis]
MSETQGTQAIIAKRLQLMGKLLDRLESIAPDDLEHRDPDDIVRLAVERIVTQVVDIAVSINQHLAAEHLGRAAQNYRESFELVVETGAISSDMAANLGPSTGMRNVLIHEYLETDTGMLAAAVPMAITGYRDYIRSVARFVS